MNSNPPPEPAGPARSYELDALRLLAALMVVSCHYISSKTVLHRASVVQEHTWSWPQAVVEAVAHGPLGVDLFFMISGYVIALSAQGRTARTFAAARFSRVLPAFWFCCLLTWCVLWLEGSPREVTLPQLLSNMVFVARPLGHDFVDGVYWSLVIEMRFYLLVALVLAWRGAAALPAFSLAWFVLAWAHQLDWLPTALRVIFLPQFAPYFLIGMALQQARHAPRSLSNALVGFGSLALVLYGVGHHTPRWQAGLAPTDAVAMAITALAALALWLVASGRTARWGRPWMTSAGLMTYPLYLLHEDLGFVLFRRLPAVGSAVLDNPLAHTVFITGVMFVLSWAVVRCIERPLAAPMRRWLAGQPPASVLSPSSSVRTAAAVQSVNK
jgi:peptidoglycan/LPS O-acetylase OafA/YrhL